MRLWQQVWRRQKWQVINTFPPQTYLLWPTSVEWTTHQHPQTNLMRGSGCSSVITLAIAAVENCRIETRSSSVNEILQLTKNFSSINMLTIHQMMPVCHPDRITCLIALCYCVQVKDDDVGMADFNPDDKTRSVNFVSFTAKYMYSLLKQISTLWLQKNTCIIVWKVDHWCELTL